MTLHRYKQIITLVAGAVVVTLALTAAVWTAERNKPNVEVVFLDIGQGDSILIKTKYNQQILIDGGPDAKVLSRLGRHLPFWDRDLDMVIATHPDADHAAGLVNALSRYQVNLVLADGVAHRTNIYRTFEELLKQKNIPVRFVVARQIYDLGEGLTLDIIYPNKSFVGQDLKDNNAASIVAKLSDGQVDYLFTGDATTAVEQELVIIYGDYLRSEVLKLGHHGSQTSTNDEFLIAVRPEAAVISVGRNNRYGHPHQVILNRLQARSIPALRTDEMGDIKLTSDGEFVELR